MSEFLALTLVETKATDRKRLQITLANAKGEHQTIILPTRLAADLGAVLTALAGEASQTGPRFTRSPKALAVGRAEHERLALLKFDDDPPYALDPDRAEDLWREMREETEVVASLKAPAIQ